MTTDEHAVMELDLAERELNDWLKDAAPASVRDVIDAYPAMQSLAKMVWLEAWKSGFIRGMERTHMRVAKTIREM